MQKTLDTSKMTDGKIKHKYILFFVEYKEVKLSQASKFLVSFWQQQTFFKEQRHFHSTAESGLFSWGDWVGGVKNLLGGQKNFQW